MPVNQQQDISYPQPKPKIVPKRKSLLSIREKEGLVVKCVMEALRYYLIGIKLILFMDHERHQPLFHEMVSVPLAILNPDAAQGWDC